MHKTIMVDGQEYELQITARKVINNGGTSVYMDREETEVLLSAIEESLHSAVDAIDYAAEQRKYEADFTRDEEEVDGLIGCAERWENISESIQGLLD